MRTWFGKAFMTTLLVFVLAVLSYLLFRPTVNLPLKEKTQSQPAPASQIDYFSSGNVA